MTNNNKILTVSYGTFSCTLEGFDDSFDTMKAIAEYFRDLAADDRYFGAEPPQPDADMLARIAEREVARRVEAREQDGRILLKAHDESVVTPAAVAAPAAAAAADPVEEEVATPEVEGTDDRAEAPVVEEVDAAEAPEDQDVQETQIDEEIATEDTPETMAEDASEPDLNALPDEDVIAETDDAAEAVVAEANFEMAKDKLAPKHVEEDGAETEAVADEVAAETDTEVHDAAAENFAEDDTSVQNDVAEEIEAQDAVMTAEAFFADSPSADVIDMDADAELESPAEFTAFDTAETYVAPETAPDAAAESIAAKLQRIREVVSQHDDDDYDQEEVAEADEPTADIEDMQFDMAEPSAAEQEEDAEPENETLNAAAQDIEDAFDADDETFAEASEIPEEEEDDLAAVLSRLDAGDTADETDLMASDEEDTPPEDAGENLFDDPDVADETDETTVEPLRAEEEAQATAVKGRVLKVDRADLEAALEAGDLEEFEGEEDGAILSADEEAELQRELDAVTAETIQTAQDPAAEHPGLPPIDAGSDEDVSRLMAEADHQMEEPEGATRRSAFAHLRAAVAARFADKTMAKEETEEETTKAYRSDLAQVVKPRRPVPSGSRTERPADQRPTPLKLVAEQRIAPEQPADADPVMPRRVAATLEGDTDFAEDTGFAEFAAEMGATKLPEVLEAAAAYLSFVEGHEQFSRPQLMTRVRQADCGDFSREDGLRSFGQLLRAGKIEKIKGGRFAASEAIGFKPDERAAG